MNIRLHDGQITDMSCLCSIYHFVMAVSCCMCYKYYMISASFNLTTCT